MELFITLGVQGATIDPTTDNRPYKSSHAAIFSAHTEQLRRVVAGMGFGAADTDDILQDVFTTASQQDNEFESSADAARWLTRITVNRCLLEFRQRKRFTRAASEILRRQKTASCSPEGPEQAAIRAEELEMVRGTLKELDVSLLAAMVLTYYCGLSSAEVGDILQINPATLRGQLREARMKLAERLLEKGFEP